MKTRIITAVVGILVLIGVLFTFDTLVFNFVIAAITLIAIHEIYSALGFEKKDFSTDLSSLSAGQKKKTALARSLCESAHLYIWDEPLNFIDVLSRIQIEELILDFRPTLLFVEHDGAFRRRVANRVIEL